MKTLFVLVTLAIACAVANMQHNKPTTGKKEVGPPTSCSIYPARKPHMREDDEEGLRKLCFEEKKANFGCFWHPFSSKPFKKMNSSISIFSFSFPFDFFGAFFLIFLGFFFCFSALLRNRLIFSFSKNFRTTLFL